MFAQFAAPSKSSIPIDVIASDQFDQFTKDARYITPVYFINYQNKPLWISLFACASVPRTTAIDCHVR